MKAKPKPESKTVRVGALSLTVRLYADGRYGFDFVPPGESRIKVRLHSIKDAEARALDILGAARGGKVNALSLDQSEIAEFLHWKANKGNGADVPSVVASFLTAKMGKGNSVHHMRQLRSDLTSFAEAFVRPINQITRADVEGWLNRRMVAARRWNNLRETLVSLFRFARREGAIGVNLCGPELVERKRVKVKVETYTPDELQKLLSASPVEWLPLLVLGAFAGIRPMEICPDPRNGGEKPPLRWENVLWEKRKVDIPAEVSKVGRRRFAALNDTAAAWLQPWRHATGPIVPRLDMHKHTSRIAKAAEVTWKNDGLRHSYASYRLAQTQDMASLALELGNSPAMIFRHYLDLKHEEEAAEWFGVLPDAPRNVVRISA
jgi:integrase